MKLSIVSATLAFILSLFMVYSIAVAEPTNQFRTPHCSPIVRNLPIYQIQANLGKGKEHQILNSSVVLIGKNTWATASHSVAWGKSTKIKIFLPGGREVPANITWSHRSKDIAVLSASSFNIKPIGSMSFDLEQHEQVWNIGFPTVAGGDLLSFTGMFVRYNKNAMAVTTALGLSGMSGGATVRCVDGRLELVGIITATTQEAFNATVWTDDDGMLHTKHIQMNAGSTIISPIRTK